MKAEKLSRSNEVSNVIFNFSVRTATMQTPQFLGLPQGAWFQDGGFETVGEGVVIGFVDNFCVVRHDFLMTKKEWGNSITLFFCWYSSFFASLSSRYSSSQDTSAGYWIEHGYRIIGAFGYRNFGSCNKVYANTYSIRVAESLALRWCVEVILRFQNRKARWKTKQLEKDYDLLKRQYDAIKADNDALQAQNQKLQTEILALKSREPTESINLNKETDGSSSNRSENSSEINLDISRTPAIDSSLSTQQSNNKTFFPSSARPTGVAQLFQTTSRPEIQCQKIDHMVNEESLSNMFCGIDDQSGLWPWLEQQHFN
ncbi:Homeobox-leucine zipper protein ATHB-13 [Glycine max]|nr:Homeobox-leucine zipper protein ATHB-13 [Glycine max]